MTAFERIIAAMPDIKCDLCGSPMEPWYGNGGVHDQLVCTALDCEAEITFPTSTEVRE